MTEKGDRIAGVLVAGKTVVNVPFNIRVNAEARPPFKRSPPDHYPRQTFVLSAVLISASWWALIVTIRMVEWSGNSIKCSQRGRVGRGNDQDRVVEFTGFLGF